MLFKSGDVVVIKQWTPEFRTQHYAADSQSGWAKLGGKEFVVDSVDGAGARQIVRLAGATPHAWYAAWLELKCKPRSLTELITAYRRL
jgi:hypothetical protein